MAPFGVNYGQLTTKPLPLTKIINMIKGIGATYVKIFDANPTVLKELANTNLKVIIALSNDKLQAVSQNLSAAESWVQAFVKNNVSHVCIGNEVTASWYNGNYVDYLMGAINNIKKALDKFNFKLVKVVCPLDISILGNSWPPSKSVFKPELLQMMKQLLTFLKLHNYPFCVNAYPYITRLQNPQQISLAYANSTLETVAFVDNGKSYKDLISAQLDAVHYACINAGIPMKKFILSETGYPTDGGTDANTVLAKTFNQNIMKNLILGQGTPCISSSNLTVIYFALCDENNKDIQGGQAVYERYWGLYSEIGVLKYSLK